MSEVVREGTGRVFRGNDLVAEGVRYRAILEPIRRYIVYIDAESLPTPTVPDRDELLTLELEDGTRVPCLHLDSSERCVGLGEPEGIRASEGL